jgi:ferritin-like metal-binding protein YciE
MSEMKTLDDLFVQKLKHVYDAEQRLVKALPKLSKAAKTPELKAAFDTHLRETESHVDRIENLFGMFGMEPDADTSDSMKGIVNAGDDMAGWKADDSVRDAGLIAAAQEAEHWEIAVYGTLRTWAQVLGKPEAAQLLAFTLDDETNADSKLTQIAERLNFRAAAPQVR